MPRRVTVAPDAVDALNRAREWLTQPGAGPKALARWQSLLDTTRRLRKRPYLGGASRDFPGLRQLVVSRYRVIYAVEPDTGESATAGDITILAIFGPGQP